MKIAILTDSGTGMSQEEAHAQGIYFLPLQILHNDTQYLDGVSIALSKVYDFLHKGEDLTTSMPPMALIESSLQHMKDDGCDEIIVIPITSGLSSTASIIQAAAKANDIKVHIIDCYSTCNNQRYLAESAKKLADKGIAVDEIVKRLKDSVACSNTLIIPDDLQHLKRGGRLTPVAAALGGLLKIKPILQLNEKSGGKIDVFDKVRTMSKAQQKAIDTFNQEGIGEDYMMTVLHTDVEEEGIALRSKVEEAFANRHMTFGCIGAVISVHTGIGCLGMQYIKRVEGL